MASTGPKGGGDPLHGKGGPLSHLPHGRFFLPPPRGLRLVRAVRAGGAEAVTPAPTANPNRTPTSAGGNADHDATSRPIAELEGAAGQAAVESGVLQRPEHRGAVTRRQDRRFGGPAPITIERRR
jgi:hypothetical protein